MKLNLLPVGGEAGFSASRCAVTVKQRAEFSTKDSATAERRYPGNALCCGGERGRCKVGYAVLYTILIGSVRRAVKGPFRLDWSFSYSLTTHQFFFPCLHDGWRYVKFLPVLKRQTKYFVLTSLIGSVNVVTQRQAFILEPLPVSACKQESFQKVQ